MELKKLLVGLEGLKVKGDLEIKVTGIESDSKKIKNGNMFIAIKGYITDGHIYIEEAIESGATAVMVEEGCDTKILKSIKDEITIVMVPDTRKAVAQVSVNYYKHPSSKFKLIGVTGTKGKTTTTFMIKNILEKAGKKVGLIGTIATYINGKKISDNDRTTPESIDLQRTFAEMVKEEVEYVVMEVSSQSLKLHRVDESEFDIVVFTNLSEDHISEKEHPDIKDYFYSKMELFKICSNGVTNADDLYGAKIQRMFPNNQIMTYGIDNFSDLMARDITVTSSYADFKVKLNGKNERVKVGIPGRFSIYNALSAIAVVQRYGIDTETIKTALLEVRVPGRSEIVDNKNELPIMIDYAHSPESLENILQAVKNYVRGKVICVFGCGGDRDKRKRPIMGEISGRIADFTIITTDNQRSENPEDIISEIEEGIKKTKGNYKTIVDRKEAIKEAIKMASKSDMIILAGKGHETEQEVNGKKYPFDERIIVKEIIDELEDEAKKKPNKKSNGIKTD